LNELNGKRPPEALLVGKRFAFIDKNVAVLLGTDPQRTFKPFGQSGIMLSELLPNLSRHVDRLCLVQTVATHQFNHHPAQLMMQTGDAFEGHPSTGSWFLYGLGSENKDLPGYIVLNSSAYVSGGGRLWQSGFLPSNHGGVLLQPAGNPVLDLQAPPGVSRSVERRGLDALARLNEIKRQQTSDPEIASRVANYELAFRMQMAAPELTDLSKESPATLARYGFDRVDGTEFVKDVNRPPAGTYAKFARHCLLARRMVERGVRFVNVFSGAWDSHDMVGSETTFFSRMVDQPIAAFIDDLAERGLLDETLVIIAGEFGRTPLGEPSTTGNLPGRDHHPDAFPMLFIGGGTKPGFILGETDDIGWSATKDPVDLADIHATMMHLFGIDHMKLTYPYRGADQRLTPLTRTARVITEMIA
jgi:hypothetical protein